MIETAFVVLTAKRRPVALLVGGTINCILGLDDVMFDVFVDEELDADVISIKLTPKIVVCALLVGLENCNCVLSVLDTAIWRSDCADENVFDVKARPFTVDSEDLKFLDTRFSAASPTACLNTHVLVSILTDSTTLVYRSLGKDFP